MNSEWSSLFSWLSNEFNCSDTLVFFSIGGSKIFFSRSSKNSSRFWWFSFFFVFVTSRCALENELICWLFFIAMVLRSFWFCRLSAAFCFCLNRKSYQSIFLFQFFLFSFLWFLVFHARTWDWIASPMNCLTLPNRMARSINLETWIVIVIFFSSSSVCSSLRTIVALLSMSGYFRL